MPSTDNNSEKPSILKSTREAKGMTLEIVHEATKIPMDALRAIEEGYKVRILSPFYYRGFIKIYSEFLGLDPVEMIKHYGLDQAPNPAAPVTSSVKKPVRKEAQPNVFLDGLQEGIASLFKPKNLTLIFKCIAFVLLIFGLFKMSGCVISHFSKKGISRKHAVSTAPVKEYATHASDKHESSVQAQSDDNKVEVAVRASQDTWLRVKTDDRVVFESTLSKGSMESWNADNKIELSGRDLELLDMEVNNKQIGFLGGGDRRIKRVLITPEGLTVKK